MANRELNIKINTTEQFVKLFNGFFDMTHKEIEIISRFIEQYQLLKDTGINAFSTESKKKVAKALDMDDYNHLNIYLKKLADKKAIKRMDSGYRINPILMPLEKDDKFIITIK